MANINYESNSHERLSAVEVDVKHLDARLSTLDRNIQENFSNLRNLINQQKQPITAFAGWASVILALVFAFGAPLKSRDARLQSRIDVFEVRELQNAYSRGQSDEKFNTLKEEIDSAVINRKDLHDKTISNILDLQRQINQINAQISHEFNNGFGKRVNEINAPILKDIEWLKKKVE